MALIGKPIIQGINKYVNEKSNPGTFLVKSTNRIYNDICITTKHPIVGCFRLDITGADYHHHYFTIIQNNFGNYFRVF